MIDVSTPEGMRALLEATIASQPEAERAALRARMETALASPRRPPVVDRLDDGTWRVYPSARYRERVQRLPIHDVRTGRAAGRAPRRAVRVVRVVRGDDDSGGSADPDPEPPHSRPPADRGST